ncbi:MAG: AAA family ATPase [Deltaproteobacteria bacterium]
MHKIYLPTLKSLEVKNYSLYLNKPDFKFDFIEGLNLIIGGNGVGKTTFVFLIKYGLIGLYKKDVDIRVYDGRKIEKRTQYSRDFFKNRMNQEYENNSNAKITLAFKINNTTYEVTRGLNDIVLEEVYITEDGNRYKLDGKVMKQEEYEKLSDNEEKKGYLQYEYEKKIELSAGLHSFEDFIFFINEILFFGEDRKTLLWNSDSQGRLASKYFNEPWLDEEFEKAKHEGKYYDSLSRHKSEDIRAVKLVLDNIIKENSDKSKSSIIKVRKQINDLTILVSKKENTLKKIQDERKKNEITLKAKHAERNKVSKRIQELESKVQAEELKVYEKTWATLHPNYHHFLKNVRLNKLCPLCNKKLEKVNLKLIISDENKCILCRKDIGENTADTDKIKTLKGELDRLFAIKQNIEKDIYNLERELNKYDTSFDKANAELFEYKSKLRNLEYSIKDIKPNQEGELVLLNTVETINKQMKELELEKIDLGEKSQRFKEKATKILEEIDESRKKINSELSKIFSSFANNYLQMPCYLAYLDADGSGKKRCIPVIDEKRRIFEEELSESQRFFIDHSFRMSIMRFFYTTPSFFICETPDSSLDISYEINAANIFLKYLDLPNSLILTSNLNNSEFLQYIINNAKRISYINLLEVGKPSNIQDNSSKLIEISKKIGEKINAKSNSIQN